MAKTPSKDETPETATGEDRSEIPGSGEGGNRTDEPVESGAGNEGGGEKERSAEDDGPVEEPGEKPGAPDTEAEDTTEDKTPEEEIAEPQAPEETPDLRDALATAPLVASGAEPEPDAAAAEREHERDEYHDEEEDEHGRSLSARILTALILLLIGAGIALWGGPKIAPHLPSGLGPVRAWLMPGALETEARVEALEEELDARISAIEPGISAEQAEAAATEVVESRVSAMQAQLADLEAQLSERIAAVSDRVEAIDAAAIEGRLAQIESRVQGLAAEVETLSGLDAVEGITDLEREQLGAFSAALDGLRARINDLADRQGALAQRIDDVQAAVQRRMTEAEAEVEEAREEAAQVRSEAEAEAALTAIDAALASGQPYEEALARFRANSDLPVPDGLAASAEGGVATFASLRDGFAGAAHDAIRAKIRAEGESDLASRLTAFLEAQVATRSLNPREGDSADAVLSRAEEALRQGDLAAAMAELESLDPAARAAMQGWLDRAQARLAATSGLAELRAAFGAEN